MRWGKPVTVDDDAGNPVTVQWLDWRGHWGGATKIDEARRELAMRLMPNVNFLREPITRKSMERFLRFFVPVILVWICIGIGSSFLPKSPWLFPVLIGSTVALTTRWFLADELKRDPQASVNTALAEGCCAGCLYALASVRTPELTKCPECGAAWRTERIGTMRGSSETAAASLGGVSTVGFDSGNDLATTDNAWRSPFRRWRDAMRLANTPIILDACERRVRLVDGKAFFKDDPRTASLTREQLGSAREAMKVGRKRTIAFIVFFSLLMLPLLYINLPVSTPPGTAPGMAGLKLLLMRLFTLVMPVFSLVMIAYTMYPALRGWRPYNGPKAARKLADAYVCPCCAGTLNNVQPDEKGNRTCLTCGSAWQTDYPKRSDVATTS